MKFGSDLINARNTDSDLDVQQTIDSLSSSITMADLETPVPSFFHQVLEGNVTKIVLRQTESIEDDVESASVKHIISHRRGLIRSSNPCAIRKRLWRWEGTNAERERLNRNHRNAMRRANETGAQREERLARARESSRRSRENRRKFIRADSTANPTTIEPAATVRIYQVDKYVRESKQHIYEHSILSPGESPLTGRVYNIIRQTINGQETVKLVPEEEPHSSEAEPEGASEGDSSTTL